MSGAPKPRDLTSGEAWLAVAVFSALVIILVGGGLGMFWLLGWFWESVVCEAVVCQ